MRDSDDLMDYPAEQYKTESELLKTKIKYLEKLIDLPDSLMSWAEDPDNRKPEFDPYY